MVGYSDDVLCPSYDMPNPSSSPLCDDGSCAVLVASDVKFTTGDVLWPEYAHNILLRFLVWKVFWWVR